MNTKLQGDDVPFAVIANFFAYKPKVMVTSAEDRALAAYVLRLNRYPGDRSRVTFNTAYKVVQRMARECDRADDRRRYVYLANRLDEASRRNTEDLVSY